MACAFVQDLILNVMLSEKGLDEYGIFSLLLYVFRVMATYYLTAICFNYFLIVDKILL